MKKVILVILFVTSVSFAQFKINRIEPPNWWTGMKMKHITLLVYGENLDSVRVSCDKPELQIGKIKYSANGNYFFVDIRINDGFAAGVFNLKFERNGKTLTSRFPVLRRRKIRRGQQGFDNRDVVYLITPDRFCNGDSTNDSVEGMIDGYNPGSMLGRHGGDIAGIISKLDYLKNLGITTIWINPLLENNMGISYHGFAATDLYRIDPRLGDNQLYKKLVDEAHARGLKVIMDHVSNHIGRNHIWAENEPDSAWFNGTLENHLYAIHIKEVIGDPHADKSALKLITDGWYVDEMPDLNQRNPLLARYLIQNTIWWIEFSGVDGIREDTYPYVDPEFLAKWARTVFEEYPDFNIVGEVWIHDPAHLALFQKNNFFNRLPDTNLPSVTDFGLFEAFGRVFGRGEDIWQVYNFLSRDFLYPCPEKLLIFADNHDTRRLMDNVNGDVDKFKRVLTLLLTTRGIPQLYYGTEIGLSGGGDDHGQIRTDFPGGITGSDHNAFTDSGRTDREQDIFNYVRKLLQLRKENSALQSGRLIHYPPSNNVYVYFRENSRQKFLIVINNSDETVELNKLIRFPAEDVSDAFSGQSLKPDFTVEAGKTFIGRINMDQQKETEAIE